MCTMLPHLSIQDFCDISATACLHFIDQKTDPHRNKVSTDLKSHKFHLVFIQATA